MVTNYPKAGKKLAKENYSNHCVVIIGGTSGIGLALALEHSRLGWHVIVVGSSLNKIVLINHSYPDIITLQYDITQTNDRQQLLAYLTTIDDHSLGINRLIYTAGWYLNERTTTLNQSNSSKMLAINLQAFNDIFTWASEYLKQHNDKLANSNIAQSSSKPALICLSSIAGLMDYPYASLYSKCKRAMIVTASAYRLALAPYNIQVNCIASGYIDTQTLRRLNNGNASHKPFIIDESTAVGHIMQAIADDVDLKIFPKQMQYLTSLLNRLPKPLLNFIMSKKLDK